MQLTKVILNNIGAYKGVHEIDLSVSPHNKNVVLFGGENGAGKTTLLNSIRIALFGAFSYGFVTDNDKYYKHIYSLLNKSAITAGETHYQIIIEFNEVENFKKNLYRFVRSWNNNNGNVKESFAIMRNGQYLSEVDKEAYHSRLKEAVPPELFNMCLFDGEEISRIVNDNKLSDYLKASARVLFNLHLFESLEDDLTQYLKQAQAEKQLSQDEEAVYKLDEKILNLYKDYENNLSLDREINDRIEELNEKVIQLKKQFDLNGGLIKEERESLQTKINDIEFVRKQNSESVKDFIATTLPLYINRELLNEAAIQIEDEHSFELHDQLSDKVTTNKLDSILSEIELDSSSSKVDKLRERLLQLVAQPDIDLIHRASFSQRSEVQAILNKLEKINIQSYVNSIEENQRLLDEAKILRKKIEVNDSTHDFREIISEIEDHSQELANLQQELIEIEVARDALSEQIGITEKERDAKKEQLVAVEKNVNSFVMASKVQDLSKKFRVQQLQKKLQHVQIEATNMLNELMRKKDYVTAIKIDPETFDVTLYNSNQHEILKDRLSSGEKEILLLSIVWAMFKCSRIKLPFIFDTLLGRLDKTHKQTVLSKLIPICSEQVIILSTDSEIDQHHYEIIEPFISKEYTLDFVISEESVSIHPHYFELTHEEVKQ
ncbi:DNA sulfur modification protein DndD [Alkalihalophilus pseudofirmus]|uniref:Nuclease SbcCD subunit C n=1 Tax=Alkalihalophilus pseudofirmus TaxID=79885 RepID=A0AAJ2L141_ALKPS|nr:DNA sulfur modification protein DndD [Alkalihalophilus pseudofirmus]MDV2884685.1 DNA sulfur modification protein DndD [Alkalihalophilus pseudofirmus]